MTELENTAMIELQRGDVRWSDLFDKWVIAPGTVDRAAGFTFIEIDKTAICHPSKWPALSAILRGDFRDALEPLMTMGQIGQVKLIAWSDGVHLLAHDSRWIQTVHVGRLIEAPDEVLPFLPGPLCQPAGNPEMPDGRSLST